jgi:hypothetical protein
LAVEGALPQFLSSHLLALLVFQQYFSGFALFFIFPQLVYLVAASSPEASYELHEPLSRHLLPLN